MKKKQLVKKLVDILLLEDIPHLGKKNTVNQVKIGYASNYLIPKQKAVLANKQILETFEKQKEEKILQLKEIKQFALSIKEEIEKIEVFELRKRLRDNKYTFSKATKKNIYQLISTRIGKDIEKLRELDIEDLPEIRERADYALKMNLHKEVVAYFTIRIVPE